MSVACQRSTLAKVPSIRMMKRDVLVVARDSANGLVPEEFTSGSSRIYLVCSVEPAPNYQFCGAVGGNGGVLR